MAMQIVGRERRKLRIRRKISGTPAKPRLSVFRSAKHIYAQVVDDAAGSTLAHASTLSKDVRATVGEATKLDAAKKVGEAIAKVLLEGHQGNRLRPQRLLPRARPLLSTPTARALGLKHDSSDSTETGVG